MSSMLRVMTTALVLSAGPVWAEEESGKSLMQQGAELFLKGLTEQMEPALDDLQALAEDFGPQMRDFFAEMGPAFGTLLEEVEDWSVYEAPERLPNGDIIIRRKPDAPAEEPTEPEEAIEL